MRCVSVSCDKWICTQHYTLCIHCRCTSYKYMYIPSCECHLQRVSGEVVEHQEVLCITCTCKHNHESSKQDHFVLELQAEMNYYVILPSIEHQSGQRRLLPQDHAACQGVSAKPEDRVSEIHSYIPLTALPFSSRASSSATRSRSLSGSFCKARRPS